MELAQENQSELGAFLKKARVEANLSQAEVAQTLRLATAQCVSNWETGRTSPPMKYLRQVCSLYEVDLNELFDLLVDYTLLQTKSKMNQDFKEIAQRKSKQVS